MKTGSKRMRTDRILITMILCVLVLIGGPLSQVRSEELSTAISDELASPADSEVLLPVVIDGKWGFINQTGKIVIEPQFAEVEDFSEGLAAAAEPTGKEDKWGSRILRWGYIDETGNWKIRPRFHSARKFSEGLAYVQLKEIYKGGYINQNGEMVIKPIFSGGSRFRNGVASVNYEMGKKASLIDKKGNTLTERKYDIIVYFRGDPIKVYVTQWFSGEYLYGFIDSTGKEVIKPQFISTGHFSEDLLPVMVGKFVKVEYGWEPEGKWGYVDTEGNFVIEPVFDRAGDFCCGLAPAIISDDFDKWGYIDKSGSFVIKPQFDNAGRFSDSLAPVCVNDKWGYINTEGEIVIEPKYDEASYFNGGFAFIIERNEDQNAKYRIIDKTGEFLTEAQFDSEPELKNGFWQVWIEDKMGYIDKTGKLIWEPTN